MPHYELHRTLLAVRGVDALDDHMEVLVGSIHDDASSCSTINERVDVDCCIPCTGLLLTHPEFEKLTLSSLVVTPRATKTVTRVVLANVHSRVMLVL